LYEKSDSTVKTNITRLENGSLEKICKLNGYSYNWKNDEKGKTEIGLIAQEVEKVLPDVVKTVDSTGEKLLAYTSIIPYLIESIKEQQEQIEVLKSKLVESSSNTSTLKSSQISEESSSEQASLSQNKPNPFSVNTTIDMIIPESVASAMLYIYDLQGKQIKAMIVAGRGATSETIYGSELQAGLYIYSLVTDGKLIGSKQMILTE